MIQTRNILWFLIVSTFLVSACVHESQPLSMNIILTKPFDMRCEFDYDFGGEVIRVGCINEDEQGCQKVISNIDKEYYYTLARTIKEISKKSHEFENIDDGEFLKISIDWRGFKDSLIINNFPMYTLEPSNSLLDIDKSLHDLYQKLDTYRCY